MKYTITENPEFKSVEIAFDEKPSESVREILKSMRFRWHSVKKVWYGYRTPEEVREALETGKASTPAKKPTEKPIAKPTEAKGVKVGDVFAMSWGYDQTNVDFFQVVEIVGSSSVRVVAVYPEVVATDGITWGSEDRTFRITSEPMRRDTRSVFLKDSEHGDVKRINDNGEGVPYIRFDGHYTARKIENGDHKMYVSWYA